MIIYRRRDVLSPFQESFMAKKRLFNRLKNILFRPRLSVIILGVEYDSYALHLALRDGKTYQTAFFFFDDEPWNHRTLIDGVQLRYPAELHALCENNAISAVTGTQADDLEQIKTIVNADQNPSMVKFLLISREELESEIDIDELVSRKLRILDTDSHPPL